MVSDGANPRVEISGSQVELKGLTKYFGDVRAVEDMDLHVERGEFITLLGPSGSGKTTTLMMMAGFVLPTRGDILINDESVVLKPPYKRNIGMVFQNYALFPHMTVEGNIAFPLKMRGVDKAKISKEVVRVLELVRLPGYQKRYPRQLSGGQQQRIALARALVFEPTLLLMDEPLGALDKKLREAMQLEVKQIQEQLGITVVYVTHDQEEALVMSDRIAVMREGRIQQLADPGTLYEYPVNHFVADFIGESNFLQAKVVSIEDDIWNMETRSGLSFRTRVAREGQAGMAVEFSIRPERVIFASESETPNTFQGEVEQVIYIGDSVKYKIRIGPEEDESLYLKQTSRSESARYRPGDQVRIGWRLQDGSLL